MSSIYQLHYANGTVVNANVTLEWISSSSTWQDHGTDQPVYLTKNSTSGSTTTSVSGVVANDRIRGFKTNTSIQRGDFIHPSGNLDVVNNQISEASDTFGIGANGYWKCISTTVTSGPTVTSITVANQNSGTRTFTVTHTGTLTASDIGYKIDGVDITSLGSPNTPITNLQTTATGSTFNSYTLSSNGYHLINIGTQYLEFYRSSTYLVQNSFPELESAGLSISFPSTNALWLAKAPGYDSVTLYNDGAQYKGTSQFNGYDRIEYLWIGTKYFSNTDPTLRGFKTYVNTYIDEPPARWLQGSVSYIDPVARYESDGLLTSHAYAGLTHIPGGYYSFDFVSLIAQAPTNTSNGGGKRRRYPIISTNLFDRQRSIYSIGLTHKDETLF